MSKVMVAELHSGFLDWAVAKVEGYHHTITEIGDLIYSDSDDNWHGNWSPSTIWVQGGGIIEREGIDLHQKKSPPYAILERRHFDEEKGDVIEYMASFKRDMVRRPNKPGKSEGRWFARMSVDSNPFGWSNVNFVSPTPLIAAMRCFVASRLGDVIDIPDDVFQAIDKKFQEYQKSLRTKDKKLSEQMKLGIKLEDTARTDFRKVMKP